MIEGIQRFVSLLRREGVAVTPAEAIDAARALSLVGVERREEFRLALKATLAKTRAEAETFDRAFRSFFAAPSAAKRPGRGAGRPAGDVRRGRPQAEGRSASPARPRPAAQPVKQEPRRRRGRLKVILDRKPGDRPAPARMEPRREREDPRRRGGRRPHGPARRRRPIVPAPADPALARDVVRILQRIRLRSGRRMRRRSRGTLWSARVMRLNVGTEGVPFVLPFRRRRPRRPRVVLLVDVSWSVIRATSTFLSIACEALASNRRTSVHFFVDRCVDATQELARRGRVDPASVERLAASIEGVDLNAPSDYGAAFYQAAHSRALAGPGRIGGGADTILVVMGDARSNYRDPQTWAFDDLAERCRRVIWLNPEPASLWDTGDSILSEYLPSCDVVCEAKDLGGIGRGVAEIIKSL